MIINPKEITDYNRNDWDIQKFFMFCIAVAGKKSEPTVKKIQAISDQISEDLVENPYYETHPKETGILHYLLGIDDEGDYGLNVMKEHKMGKYRIWGDFFEWWIDQTWNFERKHIPIFIEHVLRRFSVEKLEQIPGVGKKTSRFFKLHTDPDATCIPLDTHILKFLKSIYPTNYVPKNTPSSVSIYNQLEEVARREMKKYMTKNYLNTLAEADLAIWKSYAYK